MSARPLVAGNWKMNTTVEEGIALARSVCAAVADLGADTAEVAILPPFTHLWTLGDVLRGSGVRLGAQDVFWEDSGAYTGEVSPLMLRGWCDLVLVGHSERRHLLGESDADTARKLRRALEHGLRVILAVGETEAERDAEDTVRVVDRQLDAALTGAGARGSSVVIAYEPVWAIGTGRTATPEQAQEVCAHIREHASAALDGDTVQVLYGGSVTAANAAALFAEADIGGALVGGASLRSDEFAAIVRAATAAAPGR